MKNIKTTRYSKLLLRFILIHIACFLSTLLRHWENEQKQSKYIISEFSKEEYQQMEKKVKEMLAERENK
jgi:hypothetical protein